MIDRGDQLEPLRRGVDDVGFLLAQRLDRDRDVVRSRFVGGSTAELDQLLEGLVLWKPVGHAARAAAAEDDDAGAERAGRSNALRT